MASSNAIRLVGGVKAERVSEVSSCVRFARNEDVVDEGMSLVVADFEFVDTSARTAGGTATKSVGAA